MIEFILFIDLRSIYSGMDDIEQIYHNLDNNNTDFDLTSIAFFIS